MGEPIKLSDESSIMRKIRARAMAVNGSMGDEGPVDHEHEKDDPFEHDFAFRPTIKSHFCPFTPIGRQRVVGGTYQQDRSEPFDAISGAEALI